jgi:hypothetical protein
VKMYSVVPCEFSCPRCRSVSRSEVQFRYGNLWLHHYAIRDELVWGEPQVGNSYEAMVAVQGLGECTQCKADLEFDVIVEFGAIVSVAPSSGEHDYSAAPDYYVVIA